MIYVRPTPAEAIDQGDIIEGCPIVTIEPFDAATEPPEVTWATARVIVLTQTCDLAQRKVTRAIVSIAYDAESVIRQGLLKAAEVRGVVRAGRVFGWYFLPAAPEWGLPELVIDLRQVHTLSLEVLSELCRRGQRIVRVAPLYREHLARHFGDTYSRIGLPEPYVTE